MEAITMRAFAADLFLTPAKSRIVGVGISRTCVAATLTKFAETERP
jgi:hypothetical protein